jgi:hypothetical protein
MSFEDRSAALVGLLDELDEMGLPYVLVGGYAVSSFDTRFSTDLDVVVGTEDKGAFVTFLEERGFEHTDTHRKNWYYATEVVQYEKYLGPRQPIGFDLLINGLGCRQTDAQWSYQYLVRHSDERDVSGGTVATTARTIDGAVLVAAKIHSGRETDLRDVLAVAEALDLDDVTPHLYRGDESALCDQLERNLELLDTEELRHGFRSDFGGSTVSQETVDRLREYLSARIEWLS